MKPDLTGEKLQAAKSTLDEVSPSFCLAKWLHATVHLHNGNTQSCHHVNSHQVNPSAVQARPAALHNTDEKQAARKQMLRGERPKECSYCWAAEDRGRISDRVLKSAERWAFPHAGEVLASGNGPAITPRYLEVSFDSVCNFRCMYCSPAYSTTWMAEIQRFGAYPTSRRYNGLAALGRDGKLPLGETERNAMIEAFWNWWPELSAKLHDFRITGGEPLLSPHTFSVLEGLAVQPRPKLNFGINSNMGVDAGRIGRLIDGVNALEGKVAQFILFTSIDCVGPRAEYIRHGLDFPRFDQAVRRFLSEMRWPVGVAFMVTVNALSVSGLADLMRWIAKLRREHRRHLIRVETPFLQNPRHLSVEILPPEFVRYIDGAIEFMREAGRSEGRRLFSDVEILKVERIRGLIREPRPSRLQRLVLRRDFHKFIAEHDRRRQTDFAATFPEYAAFRESCRGLRWPSFRAGTDESEIPSPR